MAKPESYYRDHFIWIVLQLTLVFGVTNHVFDRKRRQFVYSPGAFFYRIVLHLISFILLLSGTSQLFQETSDLLHEKQFVEELGYLCMFAYMVIIIQSLFSEWISRGKATQPFNMLLRVHIDNLISSAKLAQIQRNAWMLVFWKTLSVFLVAVTTLLTALAQYRQTAVMLSIFTAYNFLMIINISIQYQFNIAMLYGGYLFKVLNVRLSQIVKDINNSLYLSHRKANRFSEELNKLGSCHTNLLKLLIGIKDIYQFDLLVFLSTMFILQLCAIFFLMIISFGILRGLSFETYMTSLGNTCVSTIDFLITLYICGDCAKACNASSGVLKDLRRLQVFHGSLNRDIDTLFIQFAREKMHLTICGMFELDINTGPTMIKGMMMKVILLTQINYKDLH